MNAHETRCLRLLLLFFFSLTITSVAVAQEATGRIVGRVTDPRGAVISGARITATNDATRISHDATTESDGTYQVLGLPIGRYTVTASSPGFKKYTGDTIPLQISQSLRVDIQLQVGSTSETIEVQGTGSTVETVSSALGQSVTSRPIVNLPLNGRNTLDLALLQPGVTPVNPGSTAAGTFSVGGGRSDSVTYLLDGGNNNNLLSNGVVYNPNPDAIEEFRIFTSNYSAEYGRNAGGIVSVVTKSGTNAFHGSVFEFVRNDAFNANSYFNKKNGLPTDILKRNQFGGRVGGPIWKDKAFFSFTYQGQRQVSKVTSPSVTTFTPTELAGNFSLSNSSRTGPDPNVVSFLNSHPFFQPNAALAAQGIIDPTKINPVAQKYITNSLIPTSPTGTLVSQGSAKNDNNEASIKFDFNLTDKDKISTTLGLFKNPTLTPFSGGANVPGYEITNNNSRDFANIAYTRIFTPNVLNVFRFSAQRNNQLQASPGHKTPTASDLGIGVTPDNPTGPPRLSFASGLTIGFSPQGPTTLIDNTFTTADTVSWVKGKHTLKFGGTYSPYQNNTVFDFFVNGNFFFDGTPAQGGIGSSNSFADFLFGLPDEYLQFGEAPSNIRSKAYYGFGQDEWRIARNLTLTLGVRYEYSSPKLDTAGRSFSLKQGQQSTVFTKAPIGLLFPGDPGAPAGANFPDKNDWAPRLGFAWDPYGDGKTSIRGGFGIFYDILKGEDNLQFNGQAPFFGFSDLFFDPVGAGTGQVNYVTQPYATNNTGTPNSFPSKPPAPNIDFDANGFLPFGGGGVFFVDPNLRTPYAEQYNLSVQRELWKNMRMETSYVGSSAHKLTILTDANPFILGTTNRVFNTQPTATSTSFSFLDEFTNFGQASYNSLEASVSKLPSDTGFLGTTFFTLSYTWSKSIDNGSGFRQRSSRVPFYKHSAFRTVSDFDVTNRIAFSAGWDLPFERAWSSGPKRLIGGWSLYPIITYRSGFPLDVFAGLSRSRTRVGPSGAGDPNLVRANLVGTSVVTLDPHQSATGLYFNPANFNTTGLRTTVVNPTDPYGTLPRNFFRGPSRTNMDLALAKSTPLIGDRLKFEFRAEFFNLLNTTEFDDPNTTITSGTFGQVSTTAAPRIIQLGGRLIF